MDDQTKHKLFEDLGGIKAQLDSIEKNNNAQWNKMECLDKRLRNQEIKAAGISGFVAVFTTFISKSLTGGG